MCLRKHWKPILTVLLLAICAVSLAYRKQVDAEIAVEDTFKKAESLIAESKFYETILILKPLLNTNERSEKHERALILADTLCRRLAKTLTDNYEKWGYGKNIADDLEKSLHALEVLGVRIDFPIEILDSYKYDHFFAKQLVKKYPESRAVAEAEYYLIKDKYYRADEDVIYNGDSEKILVELYEYIDKHGNKDIAEVYKVYLDIAHIHHGLWSMIEFSEEFDMMAPDDPPIKDSEENRARAVKFREIALTYYLKFINSKYKALETPYKHQDVLEDYQKLKQNQKSGLWFFFFGC